MQKISLLIIISFLLILNVKGQRSDSSVHLAHPQFSILFGLNQPIFFHGFNVEVNYWTKKWVFDYSHGFGLRTEGRLLGEAYTSPTPGL